MITVKYADLKEQTPAKTERKERLILLNKNVFPYLSEAEQIFILEHEAGHIYRNTSDEFTADAFASSEILGHYKNSLKCSLQALYKDLDFSNAEHRQRYKEQLKRVAKYDYEVNKNPNALKILNIINEIK